MEKRRINFDVSEEEHRKLKAKAAEQGMSIKDAILLALDRLFPGWRDEKKEE